MQTRARESGHWPVVASQKRKGRESNHAGPLGRRRTEGSRRCSASELPFLRVLTDAATYPTVAAGIVMWLFRVRSTRGAASIRGRVRSLRVETPDDFTADRFAVVATTTGPTGEQWNQRCTRVLHVSVSCHSERPPRRWRSPSSSFGVISIVRLSVRDRFDGRDRAVIAPGLHTSPPRSDRLSVGSGRAVPTE